MNQTKKTPAWVWIVSGCATMVVLAIAAFVVVGYFGYRKAQQVATEMRDPAARAAKVKDVLGCNEFPAGYHPVMGLSIPLIMDVAMLSDAELDRDGKPQGEWKRGFLYFSVPMTAGQARDLKDFFEGKKSRSEVLDQQNVRIGNGQVVKRGTISVTNADLAYVVMRGDFEIHDRRQESLTAMLRVECGGSGRAGMGFWFTPDPAPGEQFDKVDVAGTPADEAAIKEFVGHFRLCRK